MRNLLAAAAIAMLSLPAWAGGYQYHDVDVTFESADPKTKQFTISFDDGTKSSGVAEGEAATMLASLKKGDKITVTCKDTEAGEHLSATAIKKR